MSNAHYRLGADLYGKKQPQAAKAELLQAIKADPSNEDAHNLLGIIFFLEGVHAVSFIDRGQCLKGAAAEEQRQAANEKLRLAERHLERAVKLAKKDDRIASNALNFRANVAMHFERYDRAIELCNAALNNMLYVNQHVALGNRGWAAFKKGDLRSAARDLRQAMFHQPGFCLGRFRLGRVYFAQKQYDKAIEELKKVVVNDRCPIQEAYKVLGLAYLKQGLRAQARTQFEQCVEKDPKSCLSFECRRYAKLL